MKKLTFVVAGALALTLTLASSASFGAAVQGDRMVGGGWIDNPEIAPDPNIKVRTGLELWCTIDDPELRPSNMEVTWGGGNHFHLRQVDSAVCNGGLPGTDDGGIHSGTGTGVCNGSAASIAWTIGDRVSEITETGLVITDIADLVINGDNCSLTTGGPLPLRGGNFTFIDDPDI